MSSGYPEKRTEEYDGWQEPKIAVSFLNNSHVYYGVVWTLIIIFLLITYS